jgi:glutamate carboxypeptidase
MRRIACILLSLVLFGMTGAAHAQLSELEQRIVSFAKHGAPSALELLERAVRINSGTLDPRGVRGVREVGEVFRKELESLGFATRWADMRAASIERGTVRAALLIHRLARP